MFKCQKTASVYRFHSASFDESLRLSSLFSNVCHHLLMALHPSPGNMLSELNTPVFAHTSVGIKRSQNHHAKLSILRSELRKA